MTDPGDEEIEYNGVTMKVKDIPDASMRVMLGYGHTSRPKPFVIAVEGRTWETTPDVCTYGPRDWEWVTGAGPDHGYGVVAEYLVCPKCGLDGT